MAKKVTWPSRGELYGATVVVVAVTIVLSVVLGLTDSLLGYLLELIMKKS